MAFVAHAEPAWPTKPIRLIVTVPAGGAPDLVVRMAAPEMAQVLGQQVVVDNRSGAGGLIGGEIAARSTPDGYTFLAANPSPLVILPAVQKKMPYDAARDFVPISQLAIGHSLLVCHPAQPFRTVKELVATARAQPGKLDYASAGNGSVIHLAMELFKYLAGVDIRHVPYKGAPQGLTDVLGGHVGLTFIAIPMAVPHIKAERLRLLGIASGKRSPQLPNVPTVSESGVPGFEVSTWVGVLAPAKTPPAILQRMQEVAARAVRSSQVRAQFDAQGSDPVGSSAAEFAAILRSESEKYVRAVKAAGIKGD